MNPITKTATAGLVTATLLLVGCGSSGSESAETTKAADTTTTAAAATEITITDAWARQSPMGTTAGAVYLTITSPTDDALVGASVPDSVAGMTQIHETVMAEEGAEGMEEGGMEETTTTMATEMTETTMAGGSDTMTMREVESIELPAGEAVNLEPGGYHIMLLELVAPLEVGQTIEVTLDFETAPDQTVSAEVREG
jgi:periplasmic copper chaperone A